MELVSRFYNQIDCLQYYSVRNVMMAVTGIERPQFATARDFRVTAISCSPIANVAPKATFVPARKDIRLKR